PDRDRRQASPSERAKRSQGQSEAEAAQDSLAYDIAMNDRRSAVRIRLFRKIDAIVRASALLTSPGARRNQPRNLTHLAQLQRLRCRSLSFSPNDAGNLLENRFQTTGRAQNAAVLPRELAKHAFIDYRALDRGRNALACRSLLFTHGPAAARAENHGFQK